MSDIDVNALREVLAKMSPRPWRIQRDDYAGAECVVDEAYQVVLYSQADYGAESSITWSVADREGTLAIINAAESLLSRISSLEAALEEALDLAEEGWGYATPYFRDKWDSNGRADALRSLLSPPSTPTEVP